MASPFPERFDITALTGVRGRAAAGPGEAFQELIGDAFRERFGTAAHAARTVGQDGAIDLWIETPSSGEGWPDLPAPTIVECKHHGEAGSDLRRRVLDEWRKVAGVLGKRAAEGWPAIGSPWRRARGYAYAVSCRLHQALRDELEGQVRAFFAGLPPAGRPPLATILVLDWNDLRGLLDRLLRVADRWLGIGLPAIQSHAEFRAGLVGFRRFLLAEELPYLPPPDDDPAHPGRLLAELAEVAAVGSGVLLVAPGGTGKTRTSFEVAERAEAAGWRVLHGLPDDPLLETEALAEAVLDHGVGRTLVVLDYLDRLTGLDPGSLRHRVLPAARARGQVLALLATARPGQEILDNPEWKSLFRERGLGAPPQAALLRSLAHRVAPTAAHILGDERLLALLGHRPILALFVAQEIERRALENALTPDFVPGLTPDLLDWLRGRLAEAGLSPPRSARSLLPPDPDPAVLAASAVLAAAPNSREVLERVAGQVLADRAGQAGYLLERLRFFGWLDVGASGEWSAPHDVVTDDVLAGVLRLPGTRRVRVEILSTILGASLSSGRVLSRHAASVRRLVTAEPRDEAFSPHLAEAAADWLQRNAAAIGSFLVDEPVSDSSFALGALVSARPWADTALEYWSLLVAPWLRRNGRERPARHLLYVGLRRFKEPPAELREVALSWLGLFGDRQEASFVLRALLSREDLAGNTSRVLERAFEWLERHAQGPEADFVLVPLLEREDLAERGRALMRTALVWLITHHTNPNATFVISPLLSRPDLPAAVKIRLTEMLVLRLKKRPLRAEDSFLLRTLLGIQGLGIDSESSLIELGLAWCRAFSGSEGEVFLLARILRRSGLDDLHWLQAAQLSIALLRKTPHRPDRDHLAASCLRRPSLLAAEDRDYVIDDLLVWLRDNPPRAADISFLTKPLKRAARGSAFEPQVQAWLASVRLGKRPSDPEMVRTEELVAAALSNGTPPAPRLLTHGIDQARYHLEAGRYGVVGYHMSPLLPLAECWGDSNQRSEVEALVRQFVPQASAQVAIWSGFTRACWRLVDQGAWPDAARAAEILNGLGIHRPEAASDEEPASNG